MEKFVLKQEIEKLIEKGLSNKAIMEELHPKLHKAEHHRDSTWITWRIKQEIGYFSNYSKVPEKLLNEAALACRNLVNALTARKKTLTKHHIDMKNIDNTLDELRLVLNVVE